MSSRPRVLITGGTGLLGKALLETAPAGWETAASFHKNPPPSEWRDRFLPLQLEEPDSADQLFRKVRPDIVIHAASVGSVDEAERKPEEVRRVNLEGTQRIGRACLRTGARLAFISSNAVFDGRRPPYEEEAPLCPINRYGAIKAETEEWIRQSGLKPLIIRPILIYGWPFAGGRDNAVTRWVASLEQGRTIRVANDIVSMPLWAADCAQAVWSALEKELSGIVHVAGQDRVRLDQFARETARAFGLDPELVVPVPSGDLGLPAPRPADTSFIIRKMQDALGIRPLGIREGLLRMSQTRALVH